MVLLGTRETGGKIVIYPPHLVGQQQVIHRPVFANIPWKHCKEIISWNSGLNMAKFRSNTKIKQRKEVKYRSKPNPSLIVIYIKKKEIIYYSYCLWKYKKLCQQKQFLKLHLFNIEGEVRFSRNSLDQVNFIAPFAVVTHYGPQSPAETVILPLRLTRS